VYTADNQYRLGIGALISELIIPALTVLFGLQFLRVFVPGLTWMLGDRFGLGAVQLGAVALIIFSLSFLAGGLRHSLGNRRTIIITAGGMGLLRLLMQFQWPEPIVNLALAMGGIILFVLFLPVYLDVSHTSGSRAIAHFALGLLVGLAMDTAIHGAFITYDSAWQPGLPPLLVTLVLVILQWILLAFSKTGKCRENLERSLRSGARLFPWLAIGPFIFLQLVVFQNVARLAALTDWLLPYTFGWTLLSQLAALGVVVWFLNGRWRTTWSVALVSGVILLTVTAFPHPQEPWAAAVAVLAGQVSLSVLIMMVLIAMDEGISKPNFFGITVANGIGMLLLVIFLLGYYAVYQIRLPYNNTILELIAVLVVAACAVASCRSIRPNMVPDRFLWAAPLLVLLLITLPLVGAITWREAETATGNGFPVKIMTYNLHNGFNTDGYLNMEDLAQVIEKRAPDIVALQEVSRGWVISGRLDMLTWLSKRLHMSYISGPTADPLWGNAILSRYPIIESKNLELPPRDIAILRGFSSSVIDLGNGENLHIIVTHLHHIEQGSSIRQLQMPIIVDFWNGAEQTVILGDLNAEPDTPEIDLLKDAGLVDALAGAEPPVGFTFHSTDLYQRIDYIWLSPDLRVQEAYVISSKASDHLPVIAVIDK